MNVSDIRICCPHPVARIHRHARRNRDGCSAAGVVAARSHWVAKAGRPISTLYLERISPVLDREVSALFDHDLMGRDRGARRLGGLHIARDFRPVERGSGPDADSRSDKSSYCSQNDDLAHGVTLCGV